jgi:hypothetical protein
MSLVEEVALLDDFNTGRLKWNRSLVALEGGIDSISTANAWSQNLDTVSGQYVSGDSYLLISGSFMHSEFHTSGIVNDTGEWALYVNSLRVPPTDITSMINNALGILIQLNTTALGYSIDATDEFLLWGPVI